MGECQSCGAQIVWRRTAKGNRIPLGALRRRPRRRAATLRRAEFVCEACVDALATQAHHVTYVRVGRERSSDLLALCAPCHRRLHGRNR